MPGYGNSVSLQASDQGNMKVFTATTSPAVGWMVYGTVFLVDPAGGSVPMTNVTGNIWTHSRIKPVASGIWNASAVFQATETQLGPFTV
jgi:hypothetical protein